MHFRLPKPLHGWREFAGEVAIIVLGVLIALGAEQLVEEWRWHERVRTSLDSLSEQMQFDYFNAAEIVVTQPCVDAQLEQIERALSQPAAAWRPLPAYSEPFNRYVVRQPMRPWQDDVWRSMNDEGVASHLDRSLRQGIARFYSNMAGAVAYQSEASKLNFQLTALSQPLAPTPEARFQLIKDIEEVRGNYHLMKLIGNQLLGQASASGIGKSTTTASELANSGTVVFCRAHHLPLGKLEPAIPGHIK
jgi:hypothetical protein